MVESDVENASGGPGMRRRRDRSFNRDREEPLSSNISRGGRHHWRARKTHHGYGGHGQSYYNRRYYNRSPGRHRDRSPSSYYRRPRRDWDALENNTAFNVPSNCQPFGIDPHGVFDEVVPCGFTAQILSFKAFLNGQDDSIDEQEALNRYVAYKEEFRRNQVSEFFLNHKQEEWFRSKYDPLLVRSRKRAERKNIIVRLETFMEMSEQGRINDVRLDLSRSDELLELLDTAVSRFECREEDRAPSVHDTSMANDDGSFLEAVDDVTTTSLEDGERASLVCQVDVDTEDSHVVIASDVDHRVLIGSPDNCSADSVDINSQPSCANPTEFVPLDGDGNVESAGRVDDDVRSYSRIRSEDPHNQRTEDDGENHICSIFLRSLPSAVTQKDVEDMCSQFTGFKRAALSDPLPERRFLRRGWLTFEPSVDAKKICREINSQKHWSCDLGAIVNRELTRRIRPVDSITNYGQVVLNDLQMAVRIANAMDSRWYLWTDQIPDFMRDCPTYSNSFGSDTNANDEDISNYDEFAQILNARNNSALQPSTMDDDHMLYGSAQPESIIFTMTKNPFVSAAEEILERAGSVNTLDANNEPKLADNELRKALDQLILYLRIVHSIDFYNAVEYQYEDQMPNRCGILHVRSYFGLSREEQEEQRDEGACVPAREGQDANSLSVNPFTEPFVNTSQPLFTASWLAAADRERRRREADRIDSGRNESSSGADGLAGTAGEPDSLQLGGSDDHRAQVDRASVALEELADGCGAPNQSLCGRTSRKVEMIRQWITKFNERLAAFLQVERPQITREEALKLGMKDERVEIEKFVSQNVVRINEDKWTCPLSGKKFRGPEFVRKHVYNKHQGKIVGVLNEVQCFNNFVMDPKRPCLPEQVIYRPLSFARSAGRHPTERDEMLSSHMTCVFDVAGRASSPGLGSSRGADAHSSEHAWGSASASWAGRANRESRGAASNNCFDRQSNNDCLPGSRERETVKYDLNYADLEDDMLNQ